MVSVRNEAASLGALVAGLRRKLIALGDIRGSTSAGDAPSCLAHEEEFIASMERELERQQRLREGQQEDEEEEKRRTAEGGGTNDKKTLDAGASAGASSDYYSLAVGAAAETMTPLRRRIAAARVRLEEKTVVADAIEVLDASLRELRSSATVSAGAKGAASFKTLDNRY